MENKKRQHYLDLVKVLAIINLCALHYSWAGDIDFAADISFSVAFRRFVYGFYACTVPLFVMVNGALLLNRPLNLKKHYKSLLVISLQYVFWRAVSLVLIGLYNGVDFASWNLTKMVNVFLLLQDVGGIAINHLWFVPMLICLYVWFPIIKAAFDQCEHSQYGVKLLLPFMGMLLVFCFLLDDVMLFQPAIPVLNAANFGAFRLFQPMSSPLYSCMLFYFILGGLLHKYKDRLLKISTPVLLAVVLLSGLGLYGEWWVNSELMGSTYDNIFASHENLPDAFLSAAVFILCQRLDVWLSGRRKLCRVMDIVSRESLSVYYFHWILLSTVFEYLHVADGYIFNVFRSLILCAVCVLLSLILKKIPLLRKLVH